MTRFHLAPALLLLPLAVAACGRQQSADAPSGGTDPNGISVRTARDPEVAVVPGGDTTVAAPAAPSAGSGAVQALPAAPATPAAPAAPAQGRPQDANEIL